MSQLTTMTITITHDRRMPHQEYARSVDSGLILVGALILGLYFLQLHLVAKLADEYGRSYSTWFTIALFAPLLSLILVVILGPVRDQHGE
jgi:hypothetical protein